MMSAPVPWPRGPRPSRVGWKQLQGTQRVLAIIGLSVEGGVAVIVAGYSFLSMFGEGPVQQYYDWVAAPGFYAGMIVTLCTAGCAIWLVLPFTHVAPRVAVAATASFGLVLSCLAGFETYVRAWPESALLGQVHQIIPPPGAIDDKTTYGTGASSPWDDRGFASQLVATPANKSVDWSPAAVRSWRVAPPASACTQTETIARGWVDPGTLKMVSNDPSDNAGLACQWSAYRHGRQVLVDVVYSPGQPQLGQYAVFEVGTPGLWYCVLSSFDWCC
jgi:hypothetical protein